MPVYRLYLLLFVFVLSLAACTTPAPRPQPSVEDTLALTARDYVEKGDYLAAAQLYLEASKTASKRQRPGLRLDAAELLAAGKLWGQLTPMLASIDPATLDADQQARYQLLNIELALAEHQVEQALEQLQAIRSPESLPDHGQRYYQLRAEAYAMAGNPLEAARQLIWLDGLIDAPIQKLENQYRIWEQLSSLSDLSLQQLQTSPPPDPLSGWMELVVVTRKNRGDKQRWIMELDSWRARYPGHAAEDVLLPDLLNQVAQVGARVNQIAVLLPLSGRTAESAAAIRDGIMAAYYEDALERPGLRFYDTGGNAQLLWSVYQQAIEDGAEFVIGPLLKNSIQQLARSGHLLIPVLALNQIGDQQSDELLPLYQFGLAPEDEAQQVADRMFSDGHRQAIALVPDTAWGQRVFSAFEAQFRVLGGQVLETGRYTSNSADFKNPIQSTLNLDASKNRHRALENLLGQKLNYEPRRRQDAEAILMLGFPGEARQIKPQLRFHHAADLPVYSTSHVFNLSSDASIDRDMDGVLFCDIPWMLDEDGEWSAHRKKVQSAWPDRNQRYQRLFALGFDAYQVVPWLETLTMPGFAYFPGATGTLTLDQNKRLRRALEWARFENGTPRKVVSREGAHEQENDWRQR